jgi:hypothetical protein
MSAWSIISSSKGLPGTVARARAGRCQLGVLFRLRKAPILLLIHCETSLSLNGIRFGCSTLIGHVGWMRSLTELCDWDDERGRTTQTMQMIELDTQQILIRSRTPQKCTPSFTPIAFVYIQILRLGIIKRNPERNKKAGFFFYPYPYPYPLPYPCYIVIGRQEGGTVNSPAFQGNLGHTYISTTALFRRMY